MSLNDDMTLEQAQDIMAHVVANRVRWGNMYDGDDIGMSKMMRALIVLAKEDSHAVAEVRKGLTTSNRQAAAGKAREAKMKKQIEGLQNEISNLNGLNDKLSARVQQLIDPGATAGTSDNAGAEGAD